MLSKSVSNRAGDARKAISLAKDAVDVSQHHHSCSAVGRAHT